MFGRVMLSSWGLNCQRSLTVSLYDEADEANVHECHSNVVDHVIGLMSILAISYEVAPHHYK
jgi:hypothetical protein